MSKASFQNLLQKLANQIKGVLRLMVDGLGLLTFDYSLKYEKIVLIIRLDALGDFVSWLPIAEIFNTYFSERNIKTILIANNKWSKFASELKLFDEIISVDHKLYLNNLIYRYKINMQVKKYNFNMVLNPVYNREFYVSDSLIKVAKSTKKIGFLCGEMDSRHRKISDKWYTDLIRKEESIKHNIILGYAFLDYMKIDYPKKKIGSKNLFKLLENSREEIQEGIYYVIVPGSGWTGRSWPVDKWTKLTHLISLKLKMNGIVLGSKNEVNLSLNITGANKMLINLVGKTSIKKMSEIISKAKFIISNETSAVHLAMQLNIPSICILGGGHYGKFLPLPVGIEIETPPILVNQLMPCYGCNWQCPYQHSEDEAVKCIADIDVDEVFNALKLNFVLN